MDLTKVQISEIARGACGEREWYARPYGNDVLESMILAERGEFLWKSPDNKENGYRSGSCATTRTTRRT